jgi:hypothetical protein
VASRRARALAPFSWPLHHFPCRIPGQKPQLLTSTGARARKVVQGPPVAITGRAPRMAPCPAVLAEAARRSDVSDSWGTECRAPAPPARSAVTEIQGVTIRGCPGNGFAGASAAGSRKPQVSGYRSNTPFSFTGGKVIKHYLFRYCRPFSAKVQAERCCRERGVGRAAVGRESHEIVGPGGSSLCLSVTVLWALARWQWR